MLTQLMIFYKDEQSFNYYKLSKKKVDEGTHFLYAC